MKIKFINILFRKREWLLLFVMRVFIFLLCTTAFGFTTGEIFSQNTKIHIDKDQLVSIDDVFDLLREQTDYSFIYQEDLFKDLPKVQLKKGFIRANRLLESCFAGKDFKLDLKGNKIVIIATPPSNTEQQTIIISGTVSDAEGQPLPGASIIEKGTNRGTQSDFDGKFSIEVTSEKAALVVSYLGFASKEVPVGGQTVIAVSLDEDAAGLDEVVVVGYGTQKKVNLTGAVESLKVDGLNSRPLTNTSAALQGQVAGAFISQTSGQPGNDDATILIRGVSTFGNNAPLVIIDGMEGNLKDVNPSDLESVSILKDAASSAIYGNRAANGVILISTKRGSKGKMNVEYKGNYGIQEVTKIPELLKGVEFLDLQAQAQANSNGGIVPSWYTDEFMDRYRNNIDPILYPTDYDWASDIFVSAKIIDHYMNVSGGTENFQYSASVGYLDQDGVAEGNSTEKLTFRTNFNSNFLNNKLKLNLNFSGYDQKTNDFVDGIGSTMYAVYVAPSTQRRYLPGIGYTGYGYQWAAAEFGGYRLINSSPINVRMAGEFEIVEGLKLSSSYNLYRTNGELEVWKPNVVLFGMQSNGEILPGQPSVSSLQNTSENSLTKLFNTQINYSRDILPEVNFSIMAGYETRQYDYEQIFVSRDNFSANIPNLSIGDPNTQKNSGAAYGGAWRSYFGRAMFNLYDKYLVEATLRRDGSSRFLDKWGTFPSSSIAWRISEENFLKDSETITNLKLRASYGELGNEGIGQYYAASDELSLNLSTNFNNTLYPAGAVTKLANRGTSWETSSQINFGLDFGLFNNHVSGSFDYFVKRNSDILMQLPLSSTLGITTFPYQNAGAMRNEGVEMLLSYTGNIRNVKVAANLTAAHTRNKITDLAGQGPIIFGDLMWKEGEPYNSFYAYQMEGIYQSQTEIDAHLDFTDGNPYVGLVPEPGDIRFRDLNNDGIINADDKGLIGKPYPDLIYSANFELEWKGLDLGLFFQGVSGVESLNQGMVTAPFHGGSAGTGAWYRDAWTEENPSRTIQRLYSEPNRFDIVSDYYLEDASYLRLKNITLGYKLPNSWVSVIGLNSLRVFGNIQNAYTWTKMRYGFEPEKPSTATNTLVHPQTSIYSLGINLKF